MALDETLLSNFKKNDLPIFRLYRWKPALSFGRFSNVKKSINLDKIDQKNLSYIRRMTGGGILVHGQDIAYSLILPRKYLATNGVKDNYRYLCEFIINTYKKLGLNPKYAGEEQQKSYSSDICLANNEKYDILINGKKIGGNAQRYTSNILFQQGSIPLKIDTEFFKPLFLNESGLDNAMSLIQLKNTLTFQELTLLLKNTFCETFNATIVEDSLTLFEKQRTQELIKEKYNKQNWNLYGK